MAVMTSGSAGGPATVPKQAPSSPSTGFALKSFPHGVHPPEHKEATEGKCIRRLPFPPEIIVPLSQHVGAPAKPIVRNGQEVVRGEPIAEPGGFVSVPHHAPATGVVTRVAPAQDVKGTMSRAIFIRPYAGSSQEVLYGAPRDMSRMTPQEIVAAVQQAGMVGLGGAAFPTHVKLAVPEGRTIDTVIANGCECEPFLTTDHRVMLERMDDLIMGIRIAMRATKAPRAIIGIEVNKPDAIATLREAVRADGNIAVEPVKTKYPQGAEKMLIRAILRRQVPSGGLPSDVSVGVYNVATLAQLGYLLPRGQGLIERVITVTGRGVQKPGNYLVPLGTPLWFLLKHVGFTGIARQVVLGGPMMGQAVPSLNVPITKGVSGVVVFTQEELDAQPRKVYPCIRCGECVEACPVFLNPSRLGMLGRKFEYQTMEERFHLNDCFECGCCTYVCPSNIPIVQYLRIAKTVNRERKTAQ